MNSPIIDDDMRHGLQPWDGKTWFVEQPDDFVKGLFNLPQLQARDILRHAKALTDWEAEIVQGAYYSDKLPGPGVEFWLNRIEREKCGEVLP